MILTTWDAAGEKATSLERVVGVSDTRLGIWVTDVAPWQARFAHSDVCSLQQAQGVSGRPDLEQPVLEGRAQVLTEGPLFDEVRAAAHAEYRVDATLDGLADRARELLTRTPTPEGVVLVNVVG